MTQKGIPAGKWCKTGKFHIYYLNELIITVLN
jgi:hypothetical protein